VVWRKLGDIEPNSDIKGNNSKHDYENIPRRQSDDKPPMPPPHRHPPQPPKSVPYTHPKNQQVRSPPSYFDSQARGHALATHSSAASKPSGGDYQKKSTTQHSPVYNSAGGSSDFSSPLPGTSHTVHAHAIPSPQQYRSPPPPPPHVYEKPQHIPPLINYQHNYYRETPYVNHQMYSAGIQSPNQAYSSERHSHETLHRGPPFQEQHEQKDPRFPRESRHHLRNEVPMQMQGDGRLSCEGREPWDSNAR